MRDLNEMAKRVHQLNINWWRDINTGEPIKRNPFELAILIVSEVIEALEGERKDLMDDKLPHRKMAEVEMADAYIRILDYAGGFGIELSGGVAAVDPPKSKPEDLFWMVRAITFVPIFHKSMDIYRLLKAIEQYCTTYGYDLFGAIEEKLAFNAQRADHKHENRRADGGKKF